MFTFLRRRLTERAERAADQQAAPGREVQAEVPARPDPQKVLRRLEWTVIKRLDGQLQGDYRSLFRGAGLVLADLREYQSHDDVRHIDWNVTARMQTPYVREHQEDREVAAWFLVDMSGSVHFGSGAVSKRQLAAEAVTVLARLLSQHGNRVGIMLFSGTQVRAEVVVPARSGRRHLLHVLQLMLSDLPTAGTQPTAGATTDLRVLLSQAQAVIRRRASIFLVSDFITQPDWHAPLSQLARRHEVVAIRLRDRLEQEIPNIGLLLMQDAETGEQLLVDGNDAGFRARFAHIAAERENLLRQGLTRAGVDCLELTTDEPLDQAILRFTQLRKRASQMAQGAGAARA
ncbi:MAG: DUF58 domain-containing protein [Polaromonas sp.]|nr:DUF58 domain-containing protein [Polaromonas sp.]